MIVADASVIVPLLIEQPEASDLSRAVLKSEPDWVAPALWRSEVLNALSGYVRFRGLPVSRAEAAFRAAVSVVIEWPIRPDSDLIAVCREVGCSAYDAQYGVLSALTGAPLVSNDRRLVRAFSAFAASPSEWLAGRRSNGGAQ